MPLDDRPQERRNAAARLVTWLDAGVDPAAGALAVVRLRVVRSTTLVMLVLALPVAVRCWMLGRGAAAVAGLAAAAAWLVLLLVPHPWRRPVVAGRLAAAILFAALLAPALAASGAPGPVRLECGAVAALVLLGLRGGGVWTALAALATLGLGARAGASPEELAAGIFLLLATVAPVAILVACAERMGQALTAEVRARRDSEHRARAADRAKSEFLTNMSHELRTPISGVLGIADLLRKAELPERERRRLEILNTSAETLLALVDDILDLSRIEAGRLAIREIDFRPRALLEELVRMFEPRAADKGLALRLELAAELPAAIRGDPLRLRQLLLNLIGNAIKFTAEGEVVVGAEPETGKAGQQWLRFAVRDTGIGITPKEHERIFQPFSQVDSASARQHGGAGLGLAISQRLVELMGGELGLESARGAGSTFTVRLPFARAEPLAPAETVPEQQAPAPAAAELPASARVLLVDDDPVNRTVALSQLEELGLRATAVASGEEALRALATERWDAVLMDCQMPVLDGYETTRQLRRREAGSGRHAVVIAVTAHAMEGERERCLAAGMDDYLAKPYRGEELAAVLARWLPSSLPIAEDREETGRASAAPAAALPELDIEVVDGLVRYGRAHGEDHLTPLVAEYRRQSAELLAALREALDDDDHETLAGAAHRLAGSSGVLGGRVLSELAREFEKRAHAGTADAAGLERVEKAFHRLSAALDAYRADDGTGVGPDASVKRTLA